jgi:hypothetical protein
MVARFNLPHSPTMVARTFIGVREWPDIQWVRGNSWAQNCFAIEEIFTLFVSLNPRR